MSERMKIVDVIGEKIYKDGERIITQVSWGLTQLLSWESSSKGTVSPLWAEYGNAHLQWQHLRGRSSRFINSRPAWVTLYYSDSSRKQRLSWAVMAHSFNPGTQERETGRALWVWGQSGLHRKFQVNQNYVEKPYLKKKANKHIIHYWKLCHLQRSLKFLGVYLPDTWRSLAALFPWSTGNWTHC